MPHETIPDCRNSRPRDSGGSRVGGCDRARRCGNRPQRDAAYHEGTVWSWLIGPFVSAHRKVYGDSVAVREFLAPLLKQLETHAIGSIRKIFDGDPPHTPRGCVAQAWGVAEMLRVWAVTGVSE